MKNLIFDFDGVIGNTFNAVTQAMVLAGLEPNIEAARSNALAYAAKKPHHTKDHTLTDEEMSDYYKWITKLGEQLHEYGFELFTDFVVVVEELKTPNKAVVSSGTQTYVLPALATTGINPTHILSYEDHHSKEEKIEIIAKDWGVPISEVYYFTDTLADIYELKDFLAPDKLIGVSWGYCTKEQLLTELPEEQILDQASDIHTLFIS